MPLPSMRKAVRALLVDDVSFTTLLPAARLVFKAPPDVTSPFVVIQVPGNVPISGDGVAWAPLIQVDGYCPNTNPAADDIAWTVAAAAAHILGRARNVTFENAIYSGRVTDGPLSLGPDVSRGESSPLARALVRVELRVHAL